MRFKRLAVIASAGGALIAGLLVPPALSTPGQGATSEVIARGTSDDKIKSRAKRPFQVVVQNVTIDPGGHSGWHSHPGQAIVVIKSGTFTVYYAAEEDDDDDDDDDDDASCTPHVYRAGDVYVDPGRGRVHIARNESTTDPVEITVTYLDVPVATGVFRNDAPKPSNCPF